jgi:hypothetical protein
MGKLSNGVQKRKRDGKSRLVIDFRFRDKDGREKRYRKDARIQTRAGADAEARRLMEIAHTTGTLELRPDAPTLRSFVDDTFKPLFRTKFRPGTWKRYEGILSQGLLDELGDKRVDEITAPTVRAFMAVLGKRGIQSRGPVNLLRTLLTAAAETGALEAMPDLPKAPQPGRKLPSAPSTEEVNAMLANANGWLSVAVALGALAGLRQGEVRALEVRDVAVGRGPHSSGAREASRSPRGSEPERPHAITAGGPERAQRGPEAPLVAAAQLPLAPTLFPVGAGAWRGEPRSGPRARGPFEAADDAALPARNRRRPA